MEDERISRLLHDLPRHQAPPYFTAGVLRRLKQEPRHRGVSLRRFALAAGAAVALFAGVFGLQHLAEQRERQQERQQALARLEALEQQKVTLENEIRSLRRLARDAQPVVYLGSTPRVDVVVDLRRLASRSRAAGVRPASFASSQHKFPSQHRVSSQPRGENRR